MKVRDASGAAFLAAASFVACNGRISLGSPDTANAHGGRDAASGAGVNVGAQAGDGGVGAGGVPVMLGAPGDDASSSPGTNGAADAGADGGCGSMQFDPHNCGACGNDCMGGACQAGVCVPLPAGALATGQLSPTSIAVDANNVYWINEGLARLASNTQTPFGPVQILKCAKSGCNNNPTVLVTDSSDQGDGGRLRGLVVDGTNVYWASARALFACAVGGCNNTPTVVHLTVQPDASSAPIEAAGLPGVAPEIAVASGTVYASDPPSVFTDSVDAGDSTTLWAGYGGTWMWIAVDDVRAYIGNNTGEIVSCALGGCGGAPTVLVPGSWSTQSLMPTNFAQLAVDNTNLYWGMGSAFGTYMPVKNGFVTQGTATGQMPTDRILECAKAGCGGNPTTLLSGLHYPTGVATDGASVYFTEQQDFTGGATGDADIGRISKCDVAGCSNQPTPLADKLNNPRGVAVDASHVYWADFGSGGTPPSLSTNNGVGPPPHSDDGRIMMIAK